MKVTRQCFGLIMLVLLPLASRVSAQNVSGYAVMPDPFLFLLREPAIHEDLRLDDEQKRRLISSNESFDGILLAARNVPPKESQEKIAEVMTKTREHVGRLLSSAQQERLRQIAYRLRGLSFVLKPHAAKQLELSEQQKQNIQTIAQKTLETISKAHSKTYQGAEAHQKSQQTVAAARKREHEEILAALDDRQKQKLLTLVGRRFDPTSLGRVSFKAPEFAEGGQWIKSKALRIADLRGKVVALHFYTFG